MILLGDQKKAIEKLQRLKVGALFMEPGTGKTLTAIKLIESTDTDFALFIVPFQTKNNLLKELNKWQFKIPFEIVGIETLSLSDKTFVRLVKLLERKNKPFIVSDESLKIKNASAIRTRRLIKIAEYSEYRLVLNGTPISKNIMDLWSQFEFLSPKILKMTERQYQDTFVKYKKIRTERGKKEVFDEYVNMEYLHSIIEPFIFESKLDLSIETTDEFIEYKLNDFEKNDYEDAKTMFISSLFASSASFFAGTTKMQIAYSAAANKFAKIKDIVDDKTIIFTKYINTRDELTVQFPNALVLTYGKGSLGLNLQSYNKVVFFDKTFDYAQLEQAKRRIYRVGQRNNVKFYMLTGNVGLEQMIDLNINNKTSIITYFKNVANGDKETARKELEKNL